MFVVTIAGTLYANIWIKTIRKNICFSEVETQPKEKGSKHEKMYWQFVLNFDVQF